MIYTEKQARKLISAGIQIGYSNNFNIEEINSTIDMIIKSLPHTEIPNDKEIKEEVNNRKYGELLAIEWAFELGAKWMRDKIQGGNNEQ